MIYKRIIIFIFLCSISTFLVGCSIFTTKKAAKELQGNIVIWSSPQKKDLLEHEKNIFIQKNKKVTINIVSVDDDKIYDKLSQSLASDKKLPSIVEINDNYISGILNKYIDNFIDLTSSIPSIKDDFLPGKQNKIILKGRTYAFPWDTHPAAVFYRKDVFMNAGIDVNAIKTYTEYLNAGETILESTSGKSKIIAINSKGDKFLFNVFLNQLRESYFDKDGKCVVASDKSLRALKMLKSIYNSGIAFSYSDDTTLKKGIDDGTIVSIPYDNSLCFSLIKNSSALNNKWGVFNLPAFEAGGNRNAQTDGSSLMISKNTSLKDSDAAIEFAKYITTDKGALDYETSAYGIIPSYIPSYTDKVYTTGVGYFGGDVVYDTFRKISQDSPITISSPNYKKVDDEVTKACNDVIFKGADASKALKEIETEYNK